MERTNISSGGTVGTHCRLLSCSQGWLLRACVRDNGHRPGRQDRRHRRCPRANHPDFEEHRVGVGEGGGNA